jgi:hypothetical protein
VILIVASVRLRRKRRSSTSTGRVRCTRPTTRGTALVPPARPGTIAGFSMSKPSSAVAKRFE